MPKHTYTRRQMLQLSATAATAFSSGLTFAAEATQAQSASQNNLYAQLLQTWCDGLLTHQSTNPTPPSAEPSSAPPAPSSTAAAATPSTHSFA